VYRSIAASALFDAEPVDQVPELMSMSL